MQVTVADGSLDSGDLVVAVPNFEIDIAREQTRRALFPDDHRAPSPSLDRFRIERELGRGAMGVVYAARDMRLGRTVALKLLSLTDPGDKEQRSLLAEARAAAHVNHPNVVEVYGVGEVAPAGDHAVPYIAMELIEGSNLRSYLQTRKPQWPEVLRLYRDAADGLGAVHRAGLIHRDFKPDNVMVGTDGRARVMDFGLAKVGRQQLDPTSLDSDQRWSATPSTRAAGTPAYVAPEVLRGDPVTPASDQWAFCISLFEGLFGRRPFVAATQRDLVQKIAAATQAPSLPRSGLPRRAAAALRRGLSPDPSGRWDSMEALAAALGRSRRPPWALMAGCAGAVLAGVIGLRAPSSSSACGDLLLQFDSVWREDQRAALGVTFGSDQTPVQRLDQYASRWDAQYQSACAAFTNDEPLHDKPLHDNVRIQCLIRARDQASALIDTLLTTTDTHLGAAESAIQGLPDPEACELQPAAALAQSSVAQWSPQHAWLRQRLDRLEARRGVGSTDGLTEQAAVAIHTARRLDDPGLLAAAQLTYARTLMDFSSRDAARSELEEGYFLAEQADAPAQAAGAAFDLVRINGFQDSALDAAWHWWRTAEAVVVRADLASHRNELEALNVELLFRDGKSDEALHSARALLTKLEANCDAPCPTLPVAHGLLSLLYKSTGRFSEARVHGQRRIELWRERFGDRHPETLRALDAYAGVLLGAGEPNAALETIDAAEAGTLAVFGPEHLRTSYIRALKIEILVRLERNDEALAVAETLHRSLDALDEPYAEAMHLGRIALAYAATGRKDDAQRANRSALERLQSVFSEGHPEIPVLQSNIALDAYNDGDYQTALDGFVAALNARLKLVAGYDPGNLFFLANIGAALRRLGRDAEAIKVLTEAVDLADKEGLTAPLVNAHVLLWRLQHETNPTAARRVRETITARCDAVSPEVREGVDCDYLDRTMAATQREAAAKPD